LCLEGVGQKDVKEAAVVKVGQPGVEAEVRPAVAFAGMKPLHSQEGLDRATHELAAHRPRVVRYGLDPLALRVPAGDPALQAKPTTAAMTGKDLEAIQSGHCIVELGCWHGR